MDWEFFLEVWHESMAQLLSDGVPPGKIPAKGVSDIVYIWDWNRQRIKDGNCLPKWTYDPTLDRPRDISSEAVTYFSPGGDRGDGWNDVANFDAIDCQADEEDVSGRDDESLSEHGGYQDSSNGYVWPSDEYRLKVLSYSDTMLTPRLDFDMIAPSDGSKLQITTGARQNPMMGQHRISSLRVLVRHMTDMHRAVFAEGSATLDDFWEQLFLDMGSDEWGNPSPNTPKGLKERFGWVYDYIANGQMPVEVLRFMNALRQAWNEDGTILRIATHPYASKAECAIGSFLNPDLCPRWINWIMTKNDAMAKVLKWLPERYGVDINEEKIKQSYGILIPVLWEEAYKMGLLKNGDGSKAFGNSIPRNDRIKTFENQTGVNEAEKNLKPRDDQSEDDRYINSIRRDSESEDNEPKDSEPEDSEPEDSEPLDDESEDNKTTEAIKELISASYLDGNASTWAWLHLRFPQQLRKGGNSVLVDAITQLDSEIVKKKEWLTRLKMRKHLGIKDFVDDEDFRYHGRLIPTRYLSTGTYSNRRPKLFKPGENKMPYNLGFSTYQQLVKVKDGEGCFIFFDENAINFRARDGNLLHSLPVSCLKGRMVELYHRERHLLLQAAGENIASSVASSDAESGRRKRRALASGQLKSKRVRISRSQPSQADPTVHGQYWSMEEAEWLYNRVFDGESVDFHNIAKQMNGLFGIDRESRSIGSFARQFLQWRAPKLSPSAWANSSNQILWIVGKANKGMLWKDMANLFNKKFNSNRTGEELRARYEEVRRALDPKTPDAERPD